MGRFVYLAISSPLHSTIDDTLSIPPLSYQHFTHLVIIIIMYIVLSVSQLNKCAILCVVIIMQVS